MSIIGKVTATERNPSTCDRVSFWVKEGVVVRPFDIVKISHIPPSGSSAVSYSYAIIQELAYITDSPSHLANYVSSDFGNVQSEPINTRLGTTIAQAEILDNTENIEMPIQDGSPVEWADVEGIQKALGVRGLSSPVPAGYICLSNNQEIPIEFEADYLVGPEGAHLNIAGVSGLATKTSYAMFLLSAIHQKLSEKVTCIVFNVKGRDLLSLDKPNPDLTESQRNEWYRCGLKPLPFDNVTYLYPYAKRPDQHYTTSHVESEILEDQIARNRAFNYFYDLETGKRRLPLLFSDVDDSTSTMESIAHKIHDLPASTWDVFRAEIAKRTHTGGDKDKEIAVASWRKFKRLLDTRTQDDLFDERCHTNAAQRRQVLVCEAIRDLTAGTVLVIDIEPLPDFLQCMVVGDVVQTILHAKLGDEETIEADSLGTVVIFADELNKYAPKSAGSADRSLTRTLLEISERGRSLGVILFGAEQFRSHVHDRVHGNCSTNIYGRTSPVEIAKCHDYRYFPDAYKHALTRLPKGTLLLQHAVFKTALVKANFPFPAYYQPRS